MHAGCALQDFADCQYSFKNYAVQNQKIDLISAHKLLQTAAEDIFQLRSSFDAVLNKAFHYYLYMEFAKTVFKQKSKENKSLLR